MRCSKCSHETSIHRPRCAKCGAWGTITASSSRFVSLSDVEDSVAIERIPSGIKLIDDLMGGGFVRTCVYRAFGEAGCGKSRCAIDLATLIAERFDAAYCTSEETVETIFLKAKEIGRHRSKLKLARVGCVEDLDDLPGTMAFLVVDSINELASEGIGGQAGCNEQLMHAARYLSAWSKKRNAVVFVISHENRSGQVAGTAKVDHAIDCQIEFIGEGDDGSPGWINVPRKNRHGQTRRHILFTHNDHGLEYAEDPEGGKNRKPPKRSVDQDLEESLEDSGDLEADEVAEDRVDDQRGGWRGDYASPAPTGSPRSIPLDDVKGQA